MQGLRGGPSPECTVVLSWMTHTRGLICANWPHARAASGAEVALPSARHANTPSCKPRLRETPLAAAHSALGGELNLELGRHPRRVLSLALRSLSGQGVAYHGRRQKMRAEPRAHRARGAPWRTRRPTATRQARPRARSRQRRPRRAPLCLLRVVELAPASIHTTPPRRSPRAGSLLSAATAVPGLNAARAAVPDTGGPRTILRRCCTVRKTKGARMALVGRAHGRRLADCH